MSINSILDSSIYRPDGARGGSSVQLRFLYGISVLPISVFPVPGGPNRRMPFGGDLRPQNMSGLNKGNTTTS